MALVWCGWRCQCGVWNDLMDKVINESISIDGVVLRAEGSERGRTTWYPGEENVGCVPLHEVF